MLGSWMPHGGVLPSLVGTPAVTILVVVAVIAKHILSRNPKKKKAVPPSVSQQSPAVPRRLRSSSIGTTRLLVEGALPVHENKYDSIINILAHCDSGLPSKQGLAEVLMAHVVPYQRFHSIPLQEVLGGEVLWIAQKVQMEKHLIFHSVVSDSRNVAQDAMRQKVDEIVNIVLQTRAENRPWWEVHVLTLVVPSEVTSAASLQPSGTILIRIHHALGDGISLMEMFAGAITDAQGKSLPSLQKVLAPSTTTSTTAPKDSAQCDTGRTVRLTLSTFLRPTFLFNFIKSCVKVVLLTSYGSDTRCEVINPTSRSQIQNSSDTKFVVYFPSHSLELVKALKSKISASVTVNDVEFSLFSGSVRRYLVRHGQDPSKIFLRALTPFAIPEHVCPITRYSTLLRNNFTFVVNSLQLQQENAKDRIRGSHTTWSAIKNGVTVPACFFMHKVGSFFSVATKQKLSWELQDRVAFVFSNVPGPIEVPFFAGKEISRIHVIYPNVSHQIGIVSCGGMMHMALTMTADERCERIKEETSRELVLCWLDEICEAAEQLLGLSRCEVVKFLVM